MKTLIDLKANRRAKAKRDGGTIKAGFELYQDFVDAHRDKFEAWANPLYDCSGCHRQKPLNDGFPWLWSEKDKSMLNICGECNNKMKKGGKKYVCELEG